MYQALNIYSPSTFKAEQVASLRPVHYWKYEWFINTLILKHLTSKSKFLTPVSLDSQILKKLFGDRFYIIIVKDLIDTGTIKRINYRVGVHSYRFQLSNNLVKSLTKGITRKRIEKKSITRKIHLLRDQHLSEMLKDVNFQHEFQMMTSLRLEVDLALEYIDANYKKDSVQWLSRYVAIHEFDKMKDVSFSNGFYVLDFMFKKDVSGRIHSPNSHFPSDLRKFIRDSSGNKMTEIDQACSQLTYAHKFLLEFCSDSMEKMHYIGEGTIQREQQYKNEHFSKSIWDKTLQNGASVTLPSYVVQIDPIWREASHNGTAYNILMEALEYKGTKDEFKEQFFSQLFFNKYKTQLTKMEKVFKHYFPYEFGRLRMAKNALGNKGLAVQIQRQESYFWHHKVNKLMRTKYPFVVYGNVHDSILVPEDQAEQIRNDIAELLKDHFNGREALIRIKPCN